MIRRAQGKDLPRVMEITTQAIETMRQEGVRQWNQKYPAREVFVQDLAAGNLYVSEDAGVNGMFALDRNAALPYAWVDWSAESFAVVHRFAVARGARGSGVGEAMLCGAEALARRMGCESLRSDTIEQNLHMRRLFVRCGFSHVGDIAYPGYAGRFFCYEALLCGGAVK